MPGLYGSTPPSTAPSLAGATLLAEWASMFQFALLNVSQMPEKSGFPSGVRGSAAAAGRCCAAAACPATRTVETVARPITSATRNSETVTRFATSVLLNHCSYTPGGRTIRRSVRARLVEARHEPRQRSLAFDTGGLVDLVLFRRLAPLQQREVHRPWLGERLRIGNGHLVV